MNRRIDEIPVSDRLEEAVATGLQRASFIHRRRLMKKSLAIAASVAVAVTGFLGWGFSNPVLASQIPFIGHIFAKNEEKISFPGNYSDKAKILETEGIDGTEEILEENTEKTTSTYTVSDEGYTFTANEIYCDGSSLYLGMTVKADKGFGHISKSATDRYGNTTMQTINFFNAVITIHEDVPVSFPIYNFAIEGTQISSDTFEGILKVNLREHILPANHSLTVDIELYGLHYSAPDSPDLGSGVSNISGDWKITSVPFTTDSNVVDIYEINDISEDGFGIGTVVVTPSEIKVQYILPPLYKSEEEVLNAKREFLEEESIGMSDEEIQANVSITPFDDYGLAVFDADGNVLPFHEETISNDNRGFLATYSVSGADLSSLYFYIGEDGIAMLKETNQGTAESRALYKYTLNTTP